MQAQSKSLQDSAEYRERWLKNVFNLKIPFELTAPSNIRVLAYDQSGRIIATIANQYFTTGYHSISIDAGQYSSGNYFLKMVTDQGEISRKVTMIK